MIKSRNAGKVTLRIISFLVCIVLVISILSLGGPSQTVLAYDSVSIKITTYNSSNGQITGSTSNFDSSYESAGFTIYLSKAVNIDSAWGVKVLSGSGTSTIKVEIINWGDGYNKEYGLNFSAVTDENGNAVDISDIQCYSVSSYGVAASATPSKRRSAQRCQKQT